ncbi:hypothetical protein SteCoe_35836 [Stentor coeruleus]|uniref:Peroxisomal membrane protein MPV17 n=1 Tax=Stentor coeruleus TaxID=5963 RepID=A0A1R2ARC7_9CILI|nr:hypothetical protein SteCoe_35836 [Stentor coeruleus]
MLLRIIWKKYVDSLDHYPVMTKAFTGAAFGFLGDFLSQYYIEKQVTFNKKRNAVVTSYGFIETIIEGQYWINYLEKVVGKQATIANALLKTVLDLTIFAPLEIILFMAWTNYFEKSPTKLISKIKEDFFFIFANGYAFWIPVNFFCFYVVPMKHRALYLCISSVIWDTFMSFAAHNSVLEKVNNIILSDEKHISK